jgi:hypothetical protein
MTKQSNRFALIMGASSGIGAVRTSRREYFVWARRGAARQGCRTSLKSGNTPELIDDSFAMASSRIPSAFARLNIYYGWVVVAVTFLTLLVTAGAMGTPGVMIVPLEHEFGWSDAQISSALALRILLFGLFGPFAAALMNRFGVRRPG